MPAAALALLLALQSPKPEIVSFPGGMSIWSPAPMRRTSGGADAPKGAIYWRAEIEGAIFVAFVAPLPKGELETKEGSSVPTDIYLAQSTMAVLGETGALAAQQDLVLNGWNGLEVDYSSKEGLRGRCRNYLFRNTFFGVLALWAKDSKEPAEVAKCFESISTSAKIGRGPYQHAGPELFTYKLEGANISLKLPRAPVRSETTFGPARTKMTRFASIYGNRSYLVVFADIPESELQINGHEHEMLEQMNSEIVEGSKGIGRTDRDYTKGGVEVFSSVAKIAPDGAVRVDSFLKGRRVYSVISLGPVSLAGSTEVKTIFDSVTDG